jgi:hypothetical protein
LYLLSSHRAEFVGSRAKDANSHIRKGRGETAAVADHIEHGDKAV